MVFGKLGTYTYVTYVSYMYVYVYITKLYHQ